MSNDPERERLKDSLRRSIEKNAPGASCCRIILDAISQAEKTFTSYADIAVALARIIHAKKEIGILKLNPNLYPYNNIDSLERLLSELKDKLWEKLWEKLPKNLDCKKGKIKTFISLNSKIGMPPNIHTFSWIFREYINSLEKEVEKQIEENGKKNGHEDGQGGKGGQGGKDGQGGREIGD